MYCAKSISMAATLRLRQALIPSCQFLAPIPQSHGLHHHRRVLQNPPPTPRKPLTPPQFRSSSRTFTPHMSNKNCAICVSDVTRGQDEDIFTAECSHSFHLSCIVRNVKHGNFSCPICRAEVEPLSFSDDEPLLSSTSPIQSSSAENMTVKTLTESSAICASQSRPNFPVLVSVRAPPLEGHGRTPIDLVTVLDVSSSMSGSKISLVKRAMKFVIENLGPSDRLSIVSFSLDSERVFPLRRMSVDGRESAILAVESLRACGGTDIAAGLEKATRIFEDRRERNRVSSIILLSDGQDNCCGSGSQMLKKLPASIRSRSKQDEIPVHTFGFGTDHDANIMHAISDASGGTFSFVESVGMIQDSFALCIGGLLSVVAQQLQLTVKSASAGVKIVSIPSGAFVSEISDEGQQAVVHVGNIYAEEEKQFLVYLFVPQSSSAKTPLLDVQCGYTDLASNELIQVQGERVEIARPEVCSPAQEAVSLEVERQRNRILVVEAIAEAHGLAETGNLEGAKAVLAQRKAALLTSPAAQAGDGLSNMLETELREIMARMETWEEYTTTGRASFFAAASCFSQQRATTKGSSRFCGGARRGGFETASMMKMVKLSQKLGTDSAVAQTESKS